MKHQNVVEQVQAVRHHPGERAAHRIEGEVVSRQLMVRPLRPRVAGEHGLQDLQVEKGDVAGFGLVPDLAVVPQGSEAPRQESAAQEKPGAMPTKPANSDRALGHFTSSACGSRG